jgi:hypothetical protein
MDQSWLNNERRDKRIRERRSSSNEMGFTGRVAENS